MIKPRGKIVSAHVTHDHVELTLDYGVKVYISSNPEYLHVHLSGLNMNHLKGDTSINVANQGANQLDIKYTPTDTN